MLNHSPVKSNSTQEKNIRRILAAQKSFSDQDVIKKLKEQGELGCLIATFVIYLAKVEKGEFRSSADPEETLLTVPNYLLLRLFLQKPKFWRTKNYRKLVAKLTKANDKHHTFQNSNVLLNLIQYRGNVKIRKDLYGWQSLTINLRYIAPLHKNHIKFYVNRLADARPFIFKNELKYWQGVFKEEVCASELSQEKCAAEIGNRIVVDESLIEKATDESACNLTVPRAGTLLHFRVCE